MNKSMFQFNTNAKLLHRGKILYVVYNTFESYNEHEYRQM